jgi:hypothetical protein
MKKVALILLGLAISMSIVSNAHARIKYINSYYRSDGTSVSGHYRDVSNDGYLYNNANYLGLN